MVRYYASVSWGKDSLAMVLKLIDEGQPLDEIVFYDTGAEFNCIYEIMEKFKQEHPEVKVTVLRPREPFFYSMFARPVKSRKTGEIHKRGYGWCGGVCRWGTSAKTSAIDKYTADGFVYVGIAADEETRTANKQANKIFPLVNYKMTEAECLEYCRTNGYDWNESGVNLYSILDRVSCWCCRNKNQKELKAIHDYLPMYWERLVSLEDCLGQMKTRPLRQIGGDNG